jgi:hypothetical protein
MNRNRLIFAVVALLVFFGALNLGPCAISYDAALRAYVWEDINGNGRQDANEPPMGGVAVLIVYSSSGRLWYRATTGAQGTIDEFGVGIRCGELDMHLVVPDGYRPTTPVVASTARCETAKFGVQSAR